MGYAFGVENGREVGYGVKAICDADACLSQIHRGMEYRCGEGEGHGCDGFFCGDHMEHIHGADGAVCLKCAPGLRRKLHCPDCGGRGHLDEGEPCEACDSFGTLPLGIGLTAHDEASGHHGQSYYLDRGQIEGVECGR